MNQSAPTDSAVCEYREILLSIGKNASGQFDTDRVVCGLSDTLDWTEHGARAIVFLANQYGSFMLQNALALAVALDEEDGDLSF